MVGIGINESVILEKVEIVDAAKGTLVLSFKNAGADDAPVVSGFDSLNSDGYSETTGGDTLNVRLFCPLPPFAETAEGKAVPVAQQQSQAENSIKEKKNILFQIMNTFMVADKCKMDLYRNMNMTIENFASRIVQADTLEKIMVNMSEDFCRNMDPFVGKEEHPVRLLLVKRKGTDFADLRQRFVKENPFIEDGRIPLESSKLKFTKHEISKGLDDATPTGQSAADAAEDKEEAQSAESVFGAQN